QSTAQFASGSRKLAQYQHAALVPPGCQEFFCHQVHSVMQRSHQTEIGSAVVALNLFMAMVPLEKYDGLPFAGLEPPIDSFRFGLHLGKKVVVALDVSAARCSDLHKREFALVFRIFFEKSFDRSKALENPLRIAYTIDTNSQECRLHAQAAHRGLALEVVRSVVFAAAGFIIGKSYADRERFYDRPVILARDRKVFPVHA